MVSSFPMRTGSLEVTKRLATVLARELAIANARAGQFEEQVALAPELNETVPRHDGRSLARNKPGDAGGKRADQDEIIAGVLIGDGSVQP
jgi:hypothetical protein